MAEVAADLGSKSDKTSRYQEANGINAGRLRDMVGPAKAKAKELAAKRAQAMRELAAAVERFASASTPGEP